MQFQAEQRRIFARMLGALALTLAAFVLPFLPIAGAPQQQPPALTTWVSASLIVTLWVAIAVGWLARHRFVSPTDIEASTVDGGSARARQLQAMLQNTLELAFLAVVAYGGCVVLAHPRFGQLPMLCALYFSVGRALFFAGYAKGPARRAFGFGLGFYPTIGLILVSLPPALRHLMPG